jgi:hypothetical protein
MFRDTSANSMSKALLISHFELHMLPKVSKTGGILTITHKLYFE